MQILKKYTHISFDLDGTLVHTTREYRHTIVPKVVGALGGMVKETHAVDRFWFESGRDEIIRAGFGLDPSRFWELFREMDTPEGRRAHTAAYDDAAPTLRRLKEEKKTLSIITGAPHWVAQMEIAKLDAPYDYYLPIHDSGFPGKPDPEGFRFVLAKLGIAPEETLYIGNSNEDAYFAKNASVDFIYLERKEHQFDLASYALATIHSLDELFGTIIK